ncbi:hypothetical protein [Rheinheimera sp.]|uniref:hypothetical protein n=1 Tax=Rheinheimera sp. TaxID=1869214 RepID=UPI00307EDD20
MTPEELELKKFEIEAETKRQEQRAGIWKIALGTGAVGLAAAFFPFAQQYATEYFAVQIETMKQKAALEIQEKESNLKNTTLNRDFLASIGQEGRSKNLNDRIILAEYYYYLSDQESEQNRWRGFLDHLYSLRTEERDAIIDAAKISTSKESTATDIAVANTKARLIRESSLALDGANLEAPQPASTEISDLINSLTSDDTTKRRTARSAIAKQGIVVVRPLMVALSSPGIDYRTKLGVVVSLTEMMRENKDLRTQVIGLLQPDDLEQLLRLATDSDRTIRIYAGEFLYDLGDPRLLNLALSHWQEVDSDNGRYNLALIMKGLSPYLNKEQASNAIKSLRSLKGTVGPKTDSLLDEAIKEMSN